MDIALNGLYLDRIGRQVGIAADRGVGQPWRWLTTRGYYVTAQGRASLAGGDVREDLVADIAPTAEAVRNADSMFGCLPN
jgi:hypothetical protein